MEKYDHKAIEQKAQEKWASLNLYQSDLKDDTKDPYYLLIEFPYPSGDLHIGHWYAFAITDIYARLLRMRGKNVLFPIGFDAFGLPAENAAIKHGLDPSDWTHKNMERMRAQLMSMGASFDWSKEVVTCEPEYYRWTQWLFTKFFEHNLAEHREAAVKWCPHDQTVLANEQVLDGRCERCGHEVEEKLLTQWFLKITDYAERLLDGLDALPWREEIKDAQRAWIGKSEGASFDFALANRSEKISVFTTRPDTLFGVTYVVLAPEHALVAQLLPDIPNAAEVTQYVAATAQKTERERSENKEKTGVELKGIKAINPATKEEIPVYVADYVLNSYGTGAVMAVPAHDERDFIFAKKYELPIRYVIDPISGTEQENPTEKEKIVALVENDAGEILTIHWLPELGGRLLVGGTVESDEAPAVTAAREISEETGYQNLTLVEQAEETVHHSYFAFSKNQATVAHTTLLHYRLTDDTQETPRLEKNEEGKFTVEWVSREKAMQEIIEPLHKRALVRFLDTPVYTGDGLLARSGDFTGKPNREVMNALVESVGGKMTTQYRLRDWLVSRQRYWGCPLPIVYDPEGKPHAVPSEHLPWLLPTDVDFKPTGEAPLASSNELKERVTRIFGEGWTPEYDTLDTFVDSSWYFLRYLDSKDEHDFSDSALLKKWLPIDRYSGGSEHTTMHVLYARFFTKALYDLALVPVEEPFTERFNRGLIMGPDGAKMSKSKGNVINPDEFVTEYGADAVRLYLAFIGPYNEPGNYPWNLDGVASMRKFLERVDRLANRASGNAPAPQMLQDALAEANLKIAADGDRFKLNTAVSALMVLLNAFEATPEVSKEMAQQFVILLAPFAPHLAEHLWQQLGGEGSVHQQAWPEAVAPTRSEVALAIQINGKLRGTVTLSVDADEETALATAREIKTVQEHLGDAPLKRVIYVPGKIINLVI